MALSFRAISNSKDFNFTFDCTTLVLIFLEVSFLGAIDENIVVYYDERLIPILTKGFKELL